MPDTSWPTRPDGTPKRLRELVEECRAIVVVAQDCADEAAEAAEARDLVAWLEAQAEWAAAMRLLITAEMAQ